MKLRSIVPIIQSIKSANKLYFRLFDLNNLKKSELNLFYIVNKNLLNFNLKCLIFIFTKYIKDIEITKLQQQQESPQFLAHFKRKFIIHKGKRKQATTSTNPSSAVEPKMYHLRKNPYSAICTRCIQLESPVDATMLCSQFCYILCVPFENTSGSDSKGIVYVWIGKRSDPDEARLAEEIARYIYDVYLFILSELRIPPIPEYLNNFI